ncbi:MAG: hypothetical protein J3K34DRAFT_402233 [Monoraphidium minutum]|nr:MAG: hypothetical protein J3K34DRAFT_402233 [Monoraphidium minutum]
MNLCADTSAHDTCSRAPTRALPAQPCASFPASSSALRHAPGPAVLPLTPPPPQPIPLPGEIGGPRGKEPTRFGDWERGGKAVDF